MALSVDPERLTHGLSQCSIALTLVPPPPRRWPMCSSMSPTGRCSRLPDARRSSVSRLTRGGPKSGGRPAGIPVGVGLSWKSLGKS
jgi:hypothetical protein